MAKKKAPLKLQFGEPIKTKRDYRWREVAAKLRERPGEWALVQKDLPASVPSSVSGGKVRAVHPDLGFRVTTVGNRRPADGPRVCGEMWMVYEPTLDLSRAKRNGAKK